MGLTWILTAAAALRSWDWASAEAVSAKRCGAPSSKHAVAAGSTGAPVRGAALLWWHGAHTTQLTRYSAVCHGGKSSTMRTVAFMPGNRTQCAVPCVRLIPSSERFTCLTVKKNKESIYPNSDMIDVIREIIQNATSFMKTWASISASEIWQF